MQYTSEIFAFKAWPKAQFILLYIDKLQQKICQRHHKYQQRKKDIWDDLRKSNKYPEEEFLHLWKI
jgi:hypothetical protein